MEDERNRPEPTGRAVFLRGHGAACDDPWRIAEAEIEIRDMIAPAMSRPSGPTMTWYARAISRRG
jgi:hypothetical protein